MENKKIINLEKFQFAQNQGISTRNVWSALHFVWLTLQSVLLYESVQMTVRPTLLACTTAILLAIDWMSSFC